MTAALLLALTITRGVLYEPSTGQDAVGLWVSGYPANATALGWRCGSLQGGRAIRDNTSMHFIGLFARGIYNGNPPWCEVRACSVTTQGTVCTPWEPELPLACTPVLPLPPLGGACPEDVYHTEVP